MLKDFLEPKIVQALMHQSKTDVQNSHRNKADEKQIQSAKLIYY
jgi:hypothetical protein